MKRSVLVLAMLFCLPCFGATGDILSVVISGSTHQTIADANITATSTTLTSGSSCLFTAEEAHSNAPINISGAGVAGAVLATYITGFTNCNSVTIHDAASTTVTNANAEFGLAWGGQSALITIAGITSVGNNQAFYNLGSLGFLPFNPSLATIEFNVTSSGYDTSANLISRTRASIGQHVYATAPARKAYPLSTTNLSNTWPGAGTLVLDEYTDGVNLTVRVALSDPIYTPDTVTVNMAAGFYNNGSVSNNACNNCVSVTNSSPIPYSEIPVIGRWAGVPLQRYSGTFTLEAVIAHRYGNNGTPVAATVFTCADEGSHSTYTSSPVNAVGLTTQAATYYDQFAIQVIGTTIPVTSFNDQNKIDCNFKSYPWIGDSTSVLDSSTHTWPDPRLTDFPVFIDKAGTYGTPYAVVDAAGGGLASAATTYVSDTQSTVESDYLAHPTHSYTTVAWAAQAIQAFNNANHSHNDPGAGTALFSCTNGNQVTPGSTPGSTLNTPKTWFTVDEMSSCAAGSAIVTLAGSQQNLLKVNRVHYRNLNLVSTTNGGLIQGTGTTDVLWLDHNNLNLTHGSDVFAWLLAYGTGNYGTAFANPGFACSGGSTMAMGLVRGNKATVGANPSAGWESQSTNMIGNMNLWPTFVENGSSCLSTPEDNFVLAFNGSFNMNAPWANGWMGNTTTVTGGLIAYNIVENTTNNGPMFQMHNSSTGTPVNNVLIEHNSTAGQRANIGYENTGFTLLREWRETGNIFSNRDLEVDTSTGPSGMKTGAWGADYGVGRRGNRDISANFTGITNIVEPDFSGMFTYANTAAQAPGFVLNGAYGSGNAKGYGDYHLASSSPLIGIIPFAYEMFPYDLAGNKRSTNLTSVGVYAAPSEYQGNLQCTIQGTASVGGTAVIK